MQPSPTKPGSAPHTRPDAAVHARRANRTAPRALAGGRPGRAAARRSIAARFRSAAVSLACVVAVACGSLAAQGIETRSGAVVLYGNTARCSQPSQIDYRAVRTKTPEWKTIRADGVTEGSARYTLLVSEMNKRIARVCREVAEERGRDCVVRDGDVADAKGLSVVDLTAEVSKKLESEG